jgi:hypothetical protein
LPKQTFNARSHNLNSGSEQFVFNCSDDDMIFAAEIGLDRIHSHGNVKTKLSKKEDSRSEFTPFFPKFTSNEGSLLASDTQRVDAFMKQPQQKIFGCSNSIGSCESENDPLARCLA